MSSRTPHRIQFVAIVAIAASVTGACALDHRSLSGADASRNDSVLIRTDVILSPDAPPRDIPIVTDVPMAVDAIVDIGTDTGPCTGVDLTSDPNNCGSCGHVCPTPAGSRASCMAGTCKVQCVSGFHLCYDHCAADDSVTECGPTCALCPVPTNSTPRCNAGVCTFDCRAGYMLSSGMCVVIPASPCGNAMLDPGETCDDGNAAAGDGCSPTCLMESGTSTEYCTTLPSRALQITGSGTYLYSGDTTGAANDGNGGATCTAHGPELAYLLRFTIARSYSYTVTARPRSNWDLVLRHGLPCPPDGCEDRGYAGGSETYTSSATAPQDVNLVIDGYGSMDQGPFVLQIDVL